MATSVFISYAREDEDRARQIKTFLTSSGFDTWLDVDEILPGEKWRVAISRALESTDFILVCLSTRSVSKRGFVQREMRMALDGLEEMLETDIFLIPVRLDECEVPERLSELHYIDLFVDGGADRLLASLRSGVDRRHRASGGEASPPLQLGDPEPRALRVVPKPDLADLGGGGLIDRIGRNWLFG